MNFSSGVFERSSLPYSFTACKRGRRFHIHVNWYGDLVQVDPIGSCHADYYYDNGYYGYQGRRNNRYRKYWGRRTY